MIAEPMETYLRMLTEELGRTWPKLGGRIVWRIGRGDTALSQSDPAGDGEQTVEALKQALEKGQIVRFGTSGGHRGLILPVKSFGRCLGAVGLVLPDHDGQYTEALFEMFIRQVETLQKLNQYESELTALSEQLAQTYEELSLVYRISDRLVVTEKPAEYLNRFADELIEIIQAQSLIVLIKARNGADQQVFTAGRKPTSPEGMENAATYLLELAEHNRKPGIFVDLSAHPTLASILRSPEYSILTAPLATSDRVIGVMAAVGKDHDETFDSTDAKLFNSVAEQTTTFLENRNLIGDLQALLVGLLSSLVNAIDAKDPYTRGHSQRVAQISRRIARSMALSAKEVTEVYLAGLLHDVGKIGISDAVLSKPGRLTDEEMVCVQEHPVIGAKIIAGIRQLRSIIPGVLYHHEHVDGSGYPEGLSDRQIPIMASIVALADTLDAVTSERTYRKALDFDQAVEMVRNAEGLHFSPMAVQALLTSDLDALRQELHHEPTTAHGQLPTVEIASAMATYSA